VAGGSLRHELRVGWREVSSRPWVWATIVGFTVAVLCLYAQWFALAPVIARDHYGGAGVFGLLESVAARRRDRRAGGHRVAPSSPDGGRLLLVLVWPAQDITSRSLRSGRVLALAAAAGFGFSLFGCGGRRRWPRTFPPTPSLA